MIKTSLDPVALDALTREVTSFKTFQALLEADSGYFPTMDMREASAALLADFYDEAQALRGDPRRAWRTPRLFQEKA